MTPPKRRYLDPNNRSLRYLAWCYGTAPKGSAEERAAGIALVERVLGSTLHSPEERYDEIVSADAAAKEGHGSP